MLWETLKTLLSTQFCSITIDLSKLFESWFAVAVFNGIDPAGLPQIFYPIVWQMCFWTKTNNCVEPLLLSLWTISIIAAKQSHSLLCIDTLNIRAAETPVVCREAAHYFNLQLQRLFTVLSLFRMHSKKILLARGYVDMAIQSKRLPFKTLLAPGQLKV